MNPCFLTNLIFDYVWLYAFHKSNNFSLSSSFLFQSSSPLFFTFISPSFFLKLLLLFENYSHQIHSLPKKFPFFFFYFFINWLHFLLLFKGGVDWPFSLHHEASLYCKEEETQKHSSFTFWFLLWWRLFNFLGLRAKNLICGIPQTTDYT